jgi:hypothetical protein
MRSYEIDVNVTEESLLEQAAFSNAGVTNKENSGEVSLGTSRERIYLENT